MPLQSMVQSEKLIVSHG